MSLDPMPVSMREPQAIAAGDAATWERQFSNYSAASWTLHYVLRSGSNLYKFDATNDGGNFKVQLNSNVTANWAPALYAVGCYVTDANSNQVEVAPMFPTMGVTPNLAINPPGVDPVSFAAKMLALIQDTIASLTGRTVASASVNGQMYSLANINDLFKLRERWKSEVRREEAQARLNAGLGAGNKIGVRFRNPAATAWPPQVTPPW